MGLFGKNNNENQAPRNPNNVVMFRLLAIVYVGYLCIQMVQLYAKGGPDAPSLPLLLGGVALLGGGAVVLGILSYKEWKRSKVAYEEYMAELRAEAEAKRAAEEEAAEEDDSLEDEADALPEGDLPEPEDDDYASSDEDTRE